VDLEKQETPTSKKIKLEDLQKRGNGGELIQTREAKIESASDSDEMYFSFSSEEPVERYFGKEILSHDDGAADFSRLNNGTGPFLWNHDRDTVLGVVRNAQIDNDKRGYATIKWSQNPAAQEKRQDVEDGILSQVSFAYKINEVEEREEDFLVTKWSALEVSLVSIPADSSVGIGRTFEEPITMKTTTSSSVEEVTTSSSEVEKVSSDSSREAEAANAPPSPTTTISPMEEKIDVEAQTKAAVEAERSRSESITAMGDKYDCPELARSLNGEGASVEEARTKITELREERINTVEQRIQNTPSKEVGLEEKEIKRFSFLRALNALANPTDKQAQEAAAYEKEVSEAASRAYGKPAAGIMVPNEVLKRDLNVGTATAGGNLVATELLAGSFIDILRKRMALMQAGVTMLTGLEGNISIPRMTSSSTAYWVGEGASPTESQQAFDQVNLSPKTVGAYVDYTRRTLLQSSIDVEAMVRDDLAKVIALELDRAGLYGSGSSNQPLGLTGTSGIGTQTITTYGTFAEYIGMETDVATANADVASMKYLVNAAARGALKSTEKASSTAQFVWENDEINGYQAIVSNQLANNDVVFGDFSQFVVATWSGLDLTVDPYAGATSGNIRIIALQDVDYGVKQPGAFCYGT
tara:strand:- start:1030 stop:2949 length:1920 start_codon:yes stop_codon:yes gene_type:complete